MQYLLFTVIVLLSLTVVFLAVKLYLIKRTTKEIEHSFKEKLRQETNTLIDVSYRDKDMVSLADTLNKDLARIRELRHRYNQGDIELKNALANISHDLRTPLTAICGYLELLEETEKSDEVKKYLDIIEHRTKSLKQLTDELFKYSIVNSPEEKLKSEKISLNSALEESIAEYYVALQKRNITPEIKITDKKIERTLDKMALSRILSNILSNVVKYSDGDLEISLNDSGEIIFSNTATGLDEIQVAKLFDRFYTVSDARTSTGLGLSIARTLVERMNGEISASYTNSRLVICIKFN